MEARAGAAAEIKVGRGARNEPKAGGLVTPQTLTYWVPMKRVGREATGVIRLLSFLFYCFLCFAEKTIDR